MTEYMRLHQACAKQICPKFLGIKMVSRPVLMQRIHALMDRAVLLKNRELAQVACDLSADECNRSSLDELDKKLRSIETDLNEQAQREQALHHLKQSPLH